MYYSFQEVLRMPFARGRPVRAVLEHLDRLTAKMSPDGFTVPEVARLSGRSGGITNMNRIRAILSAKLCAGRVERVGPGVYRRIPGVPLTVSLPKGLVRTAVAEALSSDRKVDPWLMHEIVTFVADFTGRPRTRIRTVVSNALDDYIRHGEVHRVGTPGHYRYSRVRR